MTCTLQESAGAVLVIESDPDVRACLHTFLQSEGYQVETVATARQAMDHDRFSDFFAVLVDLDNTSPDLLREIRQTPSTEVIIAGDADQHDLARIFADGATLYLPKPIAPNMLRAAVARAARFKQAELRAQLVERLARVGEMATVLAHEGRNSLQQIANTLALLSLQAEDRPDVARVVARGERASEELRRLFDDLRCYASTLSIRREPLNVADIWRKAWAELAAHRETRAAQMVEQTDGIDLHLRGDCFRLEQVFRNLFDNALAACSDPVRIEMICSDTAYRNRPALQIVVRNNGPAFTADQRRNLFQPFFTTKSRGSGLGLAICKRILEAHGGVIQVGETDVGVEFVLVFPRREA